VSLEGPGYLFGNHEQAFRAGPGLGWTVEYPCPAAAGWLLLIDRFRPWVAFAGVVRVAKVQPQDSINGEHAAGFGEDGTQVLDVDGWCRFQSVLAGLAIIPEAVVWRAGHDAVGRFIRQRPQDLERVTGVELAARSGVQGLHAASCGMTVAPVGPSP